MNVSIREQLFAKGFKESPIAFIERKHKELIAVVKEIANTKSVRHNQKLTKRAEGLRNEIEKCCLTRGIGNPIVGEKVEYKQPLVKQ